MTKNVENWKFKSQKEIQRLKTSVLLEEWKHLTASIQLFHQNRMPWTDEMFWTFVNLSSEIAVRAEKAIVGSEPAQ